MPRRRAADFQEALSEHERRDEERHAEVMRFVGSTERYIKTSEDNVKAMFQGIADLTRLIGSTRETVAQETGKDKNNQRWVNALVILGSAVVGSGVMAFLESTFHLIH